MARTRTAGGNGDIRSTPGVPIDQGPSGAGGMPNYGLNDVIGVTGLKRFGDISRIYEEWLPELQGNFAQLVYREMYEQDPVVGATWFAIEMLCRKVSWTNSPADGSNLAATIAEFFDQQMNDMSMSFGDTLSEILTMGPYGWSLMEKCFKTRGGWTSSDPRTRSQYDDGKVAWRKLAIRSQDTRFMWMFEPSPDDGLRGMQQLAPPHYVMQPIPLAKCLLFRTKARKGNPEGVSVLRSAFRPWAFKKRIENIEGIGVERDLAGLPVIGAPAELFGAPSGLSADQTATFAALQKLVTNIKRDENEGVLMPLAYDESGNKLYTLDLLSTGGARQFDTTAIISRYKTEIAMTVLADFLLLGHSQVGSYALVDNRSDMFAEAIGSWLDSIARVIVEHGYRELMTLNAWPLELTPNLEHGKINSVDLKELGDYISKLAAAGAPLFPNDDLQTWLFEQAKMPVPEDGFHTADDMNQDRGVVYAPEGQTAIAFPDESDLKVMPPTANAVVGGGAPAVAPTVAVPGQKAPAVGTPIPATVAGAKPAPRAAPPRRAAPSAKAGVK